MIAKAYRLYLSSPNQRLGDFISHFWKPFDGSTPASSFTVCEIQSDDSKKLAGILSYVDVLDKWQDW